MNNRSSGRAEEDRFVTGTGRYVADIKLKGMLYLYVLRSPHAHALILSIDIASALATEGVKGVYTASDLAADGASVLRGEISVRQADGGHPPFTTRPVLAAGTVRHVGEAVAFVVAVTRNIAASAAEQIRVDYEPQAVIASVAAAVSKRFSEAHETEPSRAFVWRGGDHDRVLDALTQSHHLTNAKLRISRVAACPLEPSGALAHVTTDGRVVIFASHQNPYQLRQELCAALGLNSQALRVVVPDVGGSFGMKSGAYPEHVMVAWATRLLGVPVCWIAERSESFLSDYHGRDIEVDARLGLDKDGGFTALFVSYSMNVGAYLSERALPAINNIGGVAGVYKTPIIAAEVSGYLTNTVPMAPYRGAGRPEATYVIERLIDIAAREAGYAPVDLRRRNLVEIADMPWQTGLSFKYDCGDFITNMNVAEELSSFGEFEMRRNAAAKCGKLRGIGMSNPIEAAGGPFGNSRPDTARLSLRSDGKLLLNSGMLSTGQGLETSLVNLAAERLGLPAEQIVYSQGDTDDILFGHGQGGSSGLGVGGTAVVEAVARFIESGKMIAADRLEVSSADLIFTESRYSVVGTNISIDLSEVLRLANDRMASRGKTELYGEFEFKPSNVNFPNGCHICEVEIDPETGETDLINYWAVEDLGRVLNPALVEGQLHGGLAQGLGQALGEAIHYEPDGQLTTASFLDYQIPRAADMPSVHCRTLEVSTKTNALGVKGVGEAGTVGSLSAVMNAICDALSPLGIIHLDMPATPSRVYAAIQAAKL